MTQLDGLSVIHVTGTKGKGSTCAYCESVLREHGLKTGFYSSPHLVHVTERIRINGKPIGKGKFVKYFWDVHDRLSQREKDGMPMYFQMLTILAFKIFIMEKVDVAVIEVGIGGEYDTTNVLRNVPIVGITSLGYDHTSLLGNSMEEIAWHKGGIMKKSCEAFTVDQPANAMKVLKERSVEKECELHVVEDCPKYAEDCIGHPYSIYKRNVSLALTLSKAYLNLKGLKEDSDLTQNALRTCSWPGRFQILSIDNIVYHLDGAHTEDSIEHCVEWFKQQTKQSKSRKALIFNSTGDRKSVDHLKILQKCHYDKVFFVPNVSRTDKSIADFGGSSKSIERCELHKEQWLKLLGGSQMIDSEVHVFPSVFDALQALKENQHDLLVTGSLHLIGAVLNIIDPNLQQIPHQKK